MRHEFTNEQVDLIQSVLADMQVTFSMAHDERDEQRLDDLRKEINRREIEIESLRSSLEDVEVVVDLMAPVNPGVAVIFLYRADQLREEIKKLDPASLIHKVEELEKRKRWSRLVGEAVESLANEVG